MKVRDLLTQALAEADLDDEVFFVLVKDGDDITHPSTLFQAPRVRIHNMAAVGGTRNAVLLIGASNATR